MTGGGEMDDDPAQESDISQLHMDSVPEDAESDEENGQETLKTPLSNTRVPSQKSRAMLVRTPAAREQGTSPIDFQTSQTFNEEEDTQILITELRDYTEEEKLQYVEQEVEAGEYVEVQQEEEEVKEKEVFEEKIETFRDEDYDTDLEVEEQEYDIHDTTGRSSYAKICQQFGIVPVSYFVRHITDPQITMRYHGLGPVEAKAIALVLRDNITVEKLNLKGNWIQGEGGQAVSRMLEENDYITELNLGDNKLGKEGAISICKMLDVNTTLRVLDLSDNGFEDSDAAIFAETIENNKYIKELNLSRNKFSEVAGELLGPAIGANDILDVLDLSWNHLRQRGAVAVAKGVKENVRLKKVNLSWNGFGPDGGVAIADALVTNNSLQEIDISGNRMNAECAIRTAKAITCNDNIRILRMGNNLITTAGAIALARAVNESDSSEMQILDLTDVPVEFEFLQLTEEIKHKRPEITIQYGPVLRSGNTTEDLGKSGIDPKKKAPVMVLKEHILINDMRLLDILKRYDPDETFTVDPQQFMSAIDELAVPYDKPKVTEAVQRLADDQSGRIYFAKFFEKQEGNSPKESET